jgi:putative intracellular protease/amidase
MNVSGSFLRALLVSAGLVNGKRMTSFWHDGVPEDIKKAGGIYVDEKVVVDGNLVTSRYPGTCPRSCVRRCGWLTGSEVNSLKG